MQAGFTFAPLGLAFALASIFGKRLVALHGARVITVGTAIACASLLSMLLVLRVQGTAVTLAQLMPPLIFLGLGNGLSVPALIGSVLAGVRSGAAGAAAGILTTSQQFASAIGIVGLGSVFFVELSAGKSEAAYVVALEWSVALSALLALIASVLSTRLPPSCKESQRAPSVPRSDNLKITAVIGRFSQAAEASYIAGTVSEVDGGIAAT